MPSARCEILQQPLHCSDAAVVQPWSSGDAVACGRVTCALLRVVRAALPKPQTLTVPVVVVVAHVLLLTLRKQTPNQGCDWPELYAIGRWRGIGGFGIGTCGGKADIMLRCKWHAASYYYFFQSGMFDANLDW